MLPVDPIEHSRARRVRARRRRRLGRAAALLALLALAAAAALFLVRGEESAPAAAADEGRPPEAAASAAAPPSPAAPPAAVPAPAPAADRAPVPVPDVIRGVHVTMRLAATPGRLEEYLSLPGLTALQVDVKDEGGLVAFSPASVPLARELGAGRDYYGPWRLAREVHERGIYLIGRVVAFQDPILASARPELAVRRRDGSVWRNHAGKAWASPYERRVWEYNVDVAVAAARAGFDEIQFDYVRFPSDGDVGDAVFPEAERPPAEAIAAFLEYAAGRLRPLGVRVSAAVFGLSATLDVGVGQSPRLLAPHLDAIYPMAYPSHYRPGEYGLPDPNAAPGETVAATMRDFRRELEGQRTALVPWLQDFSLGRRYGLGEVRAQVAAALDGGAAGFLLWNPHGEYTAGGLEP